MKVLYKKKQNNQLTQLYKGINEIGLGIQVSDNNYKKLKMYSLLQHFICDGHQLMSYNLFYKLVWIIMNLNAFIYIYIYIYIYFI